MSAVARGLLVVLLVAAAGPALAHESRPLHVELLEEAPDRFALRWRAPGSVPAFNRPLVELPAPCQAEGPATALRGLGQQRYRCPEGLAGAVLTVRYPAFNPSVTTLVRFARLSGERHTAVLGPDESEWIVPGPETRGGVARSYLALGTAHILEGFDHLLFLACLIFIARTARRILVTVTGFTLAHSVTLALAALGLVRLPVPPVEAAIALSIVLLATEIARGRRDTLTWRRPIAVASSFGLLHGLGFASVLRDVGLPQTELPTALLFFNVGVELGQLLFIAGLVALWQGLRRVSAALEKLSAEAVLERLRLPASYAVGFVSSYWLVSRAAGF